MEWKPQEMNRSQCQIDDKSLVCACMCACVCICLCDPAPGMRRSDSDERGEREEKGSRG